MRKNSMTFLLFLISAVFSISCDGNKDNDSNDADIVEKKASDCMTDTGIVDTEIPNPLIKVQFDYTTGGSISYRSIKDKVLINLINTCVSNPVQPETCLDNWEEKYYIIYKWEITESPTPLIPESQLKLPDSSGGPGQWIPDCGSENPKRAEFTGIKVVPVRYGEENPDYDEFSCADICGYKPENDEDGSYAIDFADYIKCHQKYCEQFKTKYYKVNIQAETVEKESGNISKTADVTVIPKIIPGGRVQVQLSWKQGYRTKTEADSQKDGTKIDLDLHMIKRTSLEAPIYNYTPLEGVMGTFSLFSSTQPYEDPTNPDHYRYFRHDDCSFSDRGVEDSTIEQTIAWNASLDIDNQWGGNNFENPETISLGSIEYKNKDGIPDKAVYDDQYLIVVGYVSCIAQFEDERDTCDPEYTGEDPAYEVDARVSIMVDGEEAPRSEKGDRPADNYSPKTKDFKIKYGEWKVVAVVKWDGALPGPESNPKYPGDAIISDVAMAEAEIETDAKSYDICHFDYTDAVLVPIWNQQDYYDWVNAKRNSEDPSSEPIGKCY